jgi:release factor glutamine methyltransferase
MKTLEQLLIEGEDILTLEFIEEARLDAWYLMEYYFSIDKTFYFLNRKREISDEQNQGYMELIRKRASHMPLQFITGKQEFMGLEFIVNKNVLIPRQDTEILVEEILKISKGKKILDICTGSGCIIISLSKLGQIKSGIGVDISKEALLVARDNAIENQVDIQLFESDLFENVQGTFDIIVSNPPYIETAVIETLMSEVKLWEPHIALDGKEDGLHFYKKIIKQASKYLNKNGCLYFEIGYNQSGMVKLLLEEEGYNNVEIIKDLSGLDRVVCGNRGQ